MDRLGLLAAAVAVVAFPGGGFTAAAAALAAAGGRAIAAVSPGRRRPAGADAATWTPATVGGLAALAMGAALVPLPGSPIRALPTEGASQSLFALLALVAAAAVLCGGEPETWGRLRVAAGAACVTPVLALCTAAASFTPDIVEGLGDRRAGLARVLAAAAIVLAAPSLAEGGPRVPRWAVAGVASAFALALAEPASLAAAPGILSALAALGTAALAGLLVRVPAVVRSSAAIASGGVATVLALTLL
jgi:hypothetical protein